MAEHVADTFILPEPITIRAEACGQENAFWLSDDRAIVLCYELVAWQFSVIVEDILAR
ncbi:MAG: hypothetical protein HC898_08445 [Phycisphaerales bacterium]|nr:hypothetical protein [Phycisphaerales bacterium]